MATWQLQEAKAKLSEVIATAKKSGPQIITQHGEKTAVIMPYNEWKGLFAHSEPEPPRQTMTNEDLLRILQSGPQFEVPDRHAERETSRKTRRQRVPA